MWIDTGAPSNLEQDMHRIAAAEKYTGYMDSKNNTIEWNLPTVPQGQKGDPA